MSVKMVSDHPGVCVSNNDSAGSNGIHSHSYHSSFINFCESLSSKAQGTLKDFQTDLKKIGRPQIKHILHFLNHINAHQMIR